MARRRARLRWRDRSTALGDPFGPLNVRKFCDTMDAMDVYADHGSDGRLLWLILVDSSL